MTPHQTLDKPAISPTTETADAASLEDASLTSPTQFADAMARLDEYTQRGEFRLQKFEESITIDGAEVTERNFSGAVFREAVFVGDLKGSNFDQAQLYGADFSGACIDGSRFIGSDKIPIGTYLQFSKETVLPEVMQKVNFRKAYFEPGVDLSKRTLIDCSFKESDLSNVTLKESCISGNMSGCQLIQADLTSADLSRADLTGASLYGATLTNATISAKLQGANLCDAELTGVDLRQASLKNAKLRPPQSVRTGTHPSTAPLDFSLLPRDLSGASLQCVDLRGVDLSDYNLDGVTFEYCRVDEHTVLPPQIKAASFFKCVGESSSLQTTTFDSCKFIKLDCRQFGIPPNLVRPDFSMTNFEGMDLSNASLSEASFNTCNLQGTTWSDAQRVSVQRSNCNGANFEGVSDLSSWIFIESKLDKIQAGDNPTPQSKSVDSQPAAAPNQNNAPQPPREEARKSANMDDAFGDLSDRSPEEVVAQAVALLAEDDAVIELRLFRDSTPKHIHLYAITKISDEEALVVSVDNELAVNNAYIEERFLVDLTFHSLQSIELHSVGIEPTDSVELTANDFDEILRNDRTGWPRGLKHGNTITRIPLDGSPKEVIYDGVTESTEHFPRIPALLRGASEEEVTEFIASDYQLPEEDLDGDWLDPDEESLHDLMESVGDLVDKLDS